MLAQGLILDVDGTLVDSNDAHAEAWQRAFNEFGREFPFSLIRTQMGKGGDLLVPDLLQARDIQHFGEDLKKFRKKLFHDEYLDTIRPFPGVVQALIALHHAGLRLVFATSADEDEVEHYIELLEAKELLEGRTSKKDAKFSKPSPEIFQAALKKIGTDPLRTMVVGDTPYDILAAHRSALPIAAVQCGGFRVTDLSKAELLMQDVPELVRRMDEVERYFRED